MNKRRIVKYVSNWRITGWYIGYQHGVHFREVEGPFWTREAAWSALARQAKVAK